jgi:hypothetical protein
MDRPLSAVSVGTKVEIELINREETRERLTFEIVPDRAADFANGLLGEGTPLAKAIIGSHPGELLPYEVEDIRHIRVVSVVPGRQSELDEMAARRQAEAQKVARQIQRANAINFASSFSGKWGDYDPDGIENWD